MTVLPSLTSARRPTSVAGFAGRGTVPLLVGVAALLVLALVSAPASAHTGLTGSTPADGERLTTAPERISLEFSEAVDPSLATVILTIDRDEPFRLDVRRGESPTLVVADVPTPAGGTSNGRWQVDYRVTSVDGHPIQGTVDFVVAANAAVPRASESPSTGEPTAPGRSTAGADESGTTQTGVYIAAALLLLVLALPALLALRRARRTKRRDTSEPVDGPS